MKPQESNSLPKSNFKRDCPVAVVIDSFISLASKLPFMPTKDKMRGVVFPHFWDHIARSQNDEAARIDDVVHALNIDRSFIEFGFHAFQFNCVNLVRAGWKGLLLDGSEATVRTMRRSAKLQGYDNLSVECAFLTRSNLDPILDFVRRNDNRLGLLSIDIDGNDYWICGTLLNEI